jgi:hypothetical protein
MPNAPQVPYRVISQMHTFITGADGRPTKGWRVLYELTSGDATGTQGEVELADAHYKPENVKAAIFAQAHMIHEVAKGHGA